MCNSFEPGNIDKIRIINELFIVDNCGIVSDLWEKMCDSDEDWFEKDIDKFVVQAPTNIEHIPISKDSADTAILNNTNFFADGLFISKYI